MLSSSENSASSDIDSSSSCFEDDAKLNAGKRAKIYGSTDCSSPSEADSISSTQSSIEPMATQETPAAARPVFGSAAKTIVSFTALASGNSLPSKNLFATLIESKEEPRTIENAGTGKELEIVTGEENDQTLFSVLACVFYDILF